MKIQNQKINIKTDGKVIHYCWFSRNPLPKSAKKCIDSWKRFFPDYQIVQWNESNYNIKKYKYIKEAYKAKKYAFVSDYARFDVLYQYGGIYFDVDVEVIKPMDKLIEQGPFLGMQYGTINKLIYAIENKIPNGYVAPGLGIYAVPNMPFMKKILNFYKRKSFIKKDKSVDYTNVCQITGKLLFGQKIKRINNAIKCAGFIIYPVEYFNPLGSKNSYFSGRIKITKNTYSIHKYNDTWNNPKTSSWVKKMSIKRAKMTNAQFNRYLQRPTTKLKKSLHFNGLFRTLKKVIYRLFKI